MNADRESKGKKRRTMIVRPKSAEIRVRRKQAITVLSFISKKGYKVKDRFGIYS